MTIAAGAVRSHIEGDQLAKEIFMSWPSRTAEVFQAMIYSMYLTVVHHACGSTANSSGAANRRILAKVVSGRLNGTINRLGVGTCRA